MRYTADVPSYLGNRSRLGLVWSSRDQLHGTTAYVDGERVPT